MRERSEAEAKPHQAQAKLLVPTAIKSIIELQESGVTGIGYTFFDVNAALQ